MALGGTLPPGAFTHQGETMTAIAVAPEQAKRTYTPVEDRVVLRPLDEGGDRMIGSVILPEVAREKPQEAVVVAAGPLVKHASVGRTVLYGKYSGVEVTIDGSDYLIMREPDILLVFAD